MSRISKSDFFEILNRRLKRYATVISIPGDNGMTMQILKASTILVSEIKSLDAKLEIFGNDFWGYGINFFEVFNSKCENLDIEEIKKVGVQNKHHTYNSFCLLVFKIENKCLVFTTFCLDVCSGKVNFESNKKIKLLDFVNASIKTINKKVFIEMEFSDLKEPIRFEVDKSTDPIKTAKYYIDKIKESAENILGKPVTTKEKTDKDLMLDALSYLEKKGEQTDILNEHWKDLNSEDRKRIKLKLHDKNFILIAPYSPFHFVIKPEGEKILLTPEKLDNDGNLISDAPKKKKTKLEFSHKLSIVAILIAAIVLFFGNNILGRMFGKPISAEKQDSAQTNFENKSYNQSDSHNKTTNNEIVGGDKIINNGPVTINNNPVKKTPDNTESPFLSMLNSSDGNGLELLDYGKTFLVTFHSQGGVSRNINLFCSFAYANNFEDLNSYISDGNSKLGGSLNIGKDRTSSVAIHRDSSIHYNYFIMWCRGNYQNNDQTKTLVYDELILFAFGPNSMSYITGDLRTKVTSWMITKEMPKLK
jgi:hypothetical protein